MTNEEVLLILEVGFEVYKESYDTQQIFIRNKGKLPEILKSWEKKTAHQVDGFTCCKVQVFDISVDEHGNVTSIAPIGVHKFSSVKPLPRIINKPNVSNQSPIKEENKAQLPPQSSTPKHWSQYSYHDFQFLNSTSE